MIRIILDAICPSAVNTKLWYEKARSRKKSEMSMAYSENAKM